MGRRFTALRCFFASSNLVYIASILSSPYCRLRSVISTFFVRGSLATFRAEFSKNSSKTSTEAQTLRLVLLNLKNRPAILISVKKERIPFYDLRIFNDRLLLVHIHDRFWYFREEPQHEHVCRFVKICTQFKEALQVGVWSSEPTAFCGSPTNSKCITRYSSRDSLLASHLVVVDGGSIRDKGTQLGKRRSSK